MSFEVLDHDRVARDFIVAENSDETALEFIGRTQLAFERFCRSVHKGPETMLLPELGQNTEALQRRVFSERRDKTTRLFGNKRARTLAHEKPPDTHRDPPRSGLRAAERFDEFVETTAGRDGVLGAQIRVRYLKNSVGIIIQSPHQPQIGR